MDFDQTWYILSSQGCYGRTDGRKDGSVAISHRNFVGEGITKQEAKFVVWLYYMRFQSRRLKCEKLTDDGRQVLAKANIAFGKVS
jgi:hypothetical protein